VTGDRRAEIRLARPEDVGPLVELLVGGSLNEESTVPEDLGPFRDALAEIAATAGNDLLVAELDGEVVGMCQLVMFRHLQADGGRCAEIESMHVRRDRRSEGIGALLLSEVVDRARRAGCYRVQLTSNVARRDAHRFYEREGFVPSHRGFKLLLR
jgi:GNAT superfamily N-acetyltransferase